LQEATAELEALPNDSPLIITTALKMHQASATYRTNTVALIIFDLFELKREAQTLQKRVVVLEAKRRSAERS
jgi:hypothetical protein